MSSLTDTITEVSKAMGDIIATSEILKRSVNIVEIGQFFKLISEERKRLEKIGEILTSIENEYSTLICPQLLDINKVDSITIAGRKIAKSVRVFANISKAREENGFAWLHSEGYGEIIKTSVHPKTLSSAMKAYILDKGMLPPEDAVKCHIQEYTTIKQG